MIIRQGIDSKALLVTLTGALPRLLLLAAVGAVLGGGIYLSAVLFAGEAPYVSETEYYIDFADGRLEAKDYYNAYTWNDVIATDLILGRMMDGLGAAYERSAVGQMMSADILSDVRYLTVTVTDSDAERVAAVSEAFEAAITAFGESMEEFDAIYKIEDNGIARARVRLFSWRAALLGAVVSAGVGLFWTALAFMVGDRFYTKTDVMKFLNLPVYGLAYRNDGKAVDLQEERLLGRFRELLETHKKLYLLDAACGRDAQAFLNRLGALDARTDWSAAVLFEDAAFDGETPIVAVVPFGTVCREKITDEINDAAMRGGTVIGAALAQCDRRWVKRYYGGKGVKG